MQFYAELRQKRDLLTKRLYYNGLKAYGAVWVKKQIDRAYIEKDIGTKYTSMILDGPDSEGAVPPPVPAPGSGAGRDLSEPNSTHTHLQHYALTHIY